MSKSKKNIENIMTITNSYFKKMARRDISDSITNHILFFERGSIIVRYSNTNDKYEEGRIVRYSLKTDGEKVIQKVNLSFNTVIDERVLIEYRGE